jgi:phosphoribosylformimino-5-aminoimidazole carboxamide ribotide isomerase
MRIVPAIDIIDGKCVRLTKGDYNTSKIYSEHPLEMAKVFESYGARYLHLVDLDGAKSRQIVNHKILESIATSTSLKVDFGGGIKSPKDADIAFDCGAAQITCGSMAVLHPADFAQLLATYGAEKIILGADCKNRVVAINGWADGSPIDVVDFIRQYETKGITRVISTDINCDGVLGGPATELYRDILSRTNISLIASGGIRNIQDIANLKKLGCSGAIIGKAIYEGYISLTQLQSLC